MEEVELDGSSYEELGASVVDLKPGQKGWITLDVARVIFSAEEGITALSEFDEAGNRAVGEFAADHHVTPRREGDRVTFARE